MEYIYFENVHLFTYDLFAEKLGFKLIWGCLLFYPFFYPIGVWALVNPKPHYGDIGPASATLIALLFFFGWFLTRGANLQKYYFKVWVEWQEIGPCSPPLAGPARQALYGHPTKDH